jgi:hypothetical protein
MRLVAVGLLVMAVLGGAFAAGRSTVTAGRRPDPLRLEHGIPIGVVDTPGGALVAADNYVAAGISASLDTAELGQFASAATSPAAREQIIEDNRRLAETASLPSGASVLGSVVAHRLDSFSRDSAVVSTWALASCWGAGVAPTQYSALVQLSLRWSADRWQISAVRESVPGPVPALIGGTWKARSTPGWDRGLAGMAAPYYGDG